MSNLTKNKLSIFWFNHDLRLDDNPAFTDACKESERLLCVYCIEPELFKPNQYGITGISNNRSLFLYQSILELEKKLEDLGQRLLISFENAYKQISSLIETLDVAAVYRNKHPGSDELKVWQYVSNRYTDTKFFERDGNTIFNEGELPFEPNQLLTTFTKFRKSIESNLSRDSLIYVDSLPKNIPPPPDNYNFQQSYDIAISPIENTSFKGGESYAQNHIHNYFSKKIASRYKKTRNELDGWEQSTKFSPWLAVGCISPKQILKALHQYEHSVESNESTYWIYFELLWREYFYWYAYYYKNKLFSFSGIRGVRPLTSFYPERFAQWTNGNTNYPIVNACINQLNATGYMSNRGRQITASCLVNELQLDWRYGAAFFEKQLIDYDVAINWGNWQYLAGVGADVNGPRHFNLQKQTDIYDPNNDFIKKWHADKNTDTSLKQIDSNDIADWPIS